MNAADQELPLTKIPKNNLNLLNGGEQTNESPKKHLTDSAKHDREARALNISLESALLLTLRPEAAIDKICYVEQLGSSKSSLINSSNISELICSYLNEQSDSVSAVHYLVGCYKRILAKEVSSSASIHAELVK